MDGYRSDTAFELPVTYRGEPFTLPAKLVRYGYTYKVFVEVDGWQIIFEPDEERNLRVIVEGAPEGIDREKVRAIGEALERYLA